MQPIGISRGTWKGRLGRHPVPDHGGKIFLRIIDTNVQDYMVLKSTRK